MLHRSTFQLLRFHFSFFLLPVYLFAVSQVDKINWIRAIIIFCILHLLVYPSSNGYNSYMDKDDSPIGGLADPMQPTKELFYVSVIMDAFAVILSFFISAYFAIGVFVYITVSRMYSYRGIRLKKYPIIGYLTVIIFQGAWIFCLAYYGSNKPKAFSIPVIPACAATLLIGGYYPLTQVYQHEEDKKDNVTTISMLLGKKGTFIFCGIIFALATLFIFLTFQHEHSFRSFLTFTTCMLPMIVFFLIWMRKVWKNEANADFKNSLRMNALASICTTVCFIILIVTKHFE